MTKYFLMMLLALVFCSTAGADLYVNIGTSGGPWPSAPNVITPLSGEPDWMPASFKTFCVERFTTFNLSPGNYWATIDDDILNASGSPSPVLEDDVKKTYAAFLNGGFDIGFNMNDIQQHIWLQQGYSVTALDSTTATSISNVVTDADYIRGWEDVKVLNLWRNANFTGDVQSQLVMTPVPGAGLLGAIGLGLASWWLRRKKVVADS